MFNGLDEINWKGLQHAYGAATDTPRNIRRLLCPSASKRKAAINSLEYSIYHQGSVYAATVPAIKFLVEAALHPAAQERQDILYLLADIASGSGWFTSHESLPFIRRAFHANTIEREKMKESRVDVDLRRELSHVAPTVFPLLNSEVAEVRLATSHLLTQLPESAEFVTQAMASRFTIETVDSVRANILRGIATINHDVAYRLCETVDCQAAASMTTGLANAIVAEKQELASERAVALRRQVLNDSTEFIDGYSSLPSTDDYFVDLATSMAMSDSEFAEQVSRRIVEIQRQSPHPKIIGYGRAVALLLFTLVPGGVRSHVSELQAWQKDAVWIVACSAWPKAKYTFGIMVDVLDRFNLPISPELLADTIGYSLDRFDWYRPKRWWRFWAGWH